jgi:hypothetical protein
MADVLRLDVPPETPSTHRRTGGIVIGIAAILGAVGYGFSQIPPTHDKALAAGRSLHLCSPEPPSDIQPFQSGWLGSGSTFASAVKDTLSGYRAKYPDWNIDFVEGREYSRKDFWGQPGYRYEGSFRVTPKWQGSFCYGLRVDSRAST